MKLYCTICRSDVCCNGSYFFFANGWSGLREYIGANPALNLDSATTVVHPKISDVSLPSGEYDAEVQDEFFDAIAADSSSSSEDEESDSDEHDNKVFPFLPLLHQK